jgi:hypothetical protein
VAATDERVSVELPFSQQRAMVWTQPLVRLELRRRPDRNDLDAVPGQRKRPLSVEVLDPGHANP